MTLNKSLFNIGIFKNTVYRFKWGSFLYFVALFFSCPFYLLVANFERLADRVLGSNIDTPIWIILRSNNLTVPMLLAVLVPTVVAVLVFNNVHSGKQAIFTHGLPCDRRQIYISNLAAAFVLMATPVLLNSIILTIMSFGKYGQVMPFVSIVYWTALNLNMLFVMFSVATFSAFLTGNIAAHIGINIFLHFIPVVIGLAIMLISEHFLYGFFEAENFIATELVMNNPIVWLFGRSLSLYSVAGSGMPLFKTLQTWIYIIGAVLVYVLAYLLYKNRKIEACGDIAAFGFFKPILKYSVVTAAAVALFAVLTSTDMDAWAIFVMALVITAIVYFAAEMLMNKSFKVFKTTYKGYFGFVLCCAAFIAFFAYTNVFGYETRMPKHEEIESAGIYEYLGGRDSMTFSDPLLIEDTIKIHQEIISDIPVISSQNSYDGVYRYLYLDYRLKSGQILQRRYTVTLELFDRAMSDMYKSKDYKLKTTTLDNINIDNVNNLVIGATSSDYAFHISLNDDADDLMRAIKTDVEHLSYEEMEKANSVLSVSVEFECTVEENEKLQYFKDAGYKIGSDEAKYAYKNFRIVINSNYKNAYAFLKEKGYYDQIVNQMAQGLVICKKPIAKAGELVTYKGDTGSFSNFSISTDDCVDISQADERMLAEEFATSKRNDLADGTSYLVFIISNNYTANPHAMNYAQVIKAEEMPEYLKKYVEQ